ncbi:hypothetical protein niasHS_003949 [Heterodera schachtii]|uniref:Complex III subunit 9 n=1 Tax=Heterodera schachtii TaxID=97005 RepID=A0ABD2K3M7_HETSC
MGFYDTFYRNFGRRFSTLLLAATGGAVFIDVVMNRFTDAIWDWNNQGKQWKDIKHLQQSIRQTVKHFDFCFT